MGAVVSALRCIQRDVSDTPARTPRAIRALLRAIETEESGADVSEAEKAK